MTRSGGGEIDIDTRVIVVVEGTVLLLMETTWLEVVTKDVKSIDWVMTVIVVVLMTVVVIVVQCERLANVDGIGLVELWCNRGRRQRRRR